MKSLWKTNNRNWKKHYYINKKIASVFLTFFTFKNIFKSKHGAHTFNGIEMCFQNWNRPKF